MSNPLLKHQDSSNLIIENAGHGYRYYGVDREPNKEVIKEIEDFMSEKLPRYFHRFCNFKTNKDGTKSVRFLAHYSPSFIGVDYLPVSAFEEKSDEDA